MLNAITEAAQNGTVTWLAVRGERSAAIVPPDLAEAAAALFAAAHAEGTDVGEFTCRVLALLAARLGSSEAVTANRPGSWEAGFVTQMLAATVGPDDDYLDRYQAPGGGPDERA